MPLYVLDLCHGCTFCFCFSNLWIRAEVEDGGYAQLLAELLFAGGGDAGGICAAVDVIPAEGAGWRGGGRYGVATNIAEIMNARNIVEGRGW